jgi:hypothetical protein
MTLAEKVSHATAVAMWPIPKAWLTYSSRPPAEGKRAPSLAKE